MVLSENSDCLPLPKIMRESFSTREIHELLEQRPQMPCQMAERSSDIGARPHISQNANAEDAVTEYWN